MEGGVEIVAGAIQHYTLLMPQNWPKMAKTAVKGGTHLNPCSQEIEAQQSQQLFLVIVNVIVY